MPIDPEHWPTRRVIAARILLGIERELSQYLRMQKIIDDIKRRCGVTNREK